MPGDRSKMDRGIGDGIDGGATSSSELTLPESGLFLEGTTGLEGEAVPAEIRGVAVA